LVTRCVEGTSIKETPVSGRAARELVHVGHGLHALVGGLARAGWSILRSVATCTKWRRVYHVVRVASKGSSGRGARWTPLGGERGGTSNALIGTIIAVL